MALLFAGCELQDYDPVGTLASYVTSTTLVHRRSNLVRQAVGISLLSANKETSFARKKIKTPVSSVWVTFRHFATTNSTTANQMLFMLGRNGTRRIGIVGNGTTGKFVLAKVSAANAYTTLAVESGTFLATTLYKYDLQIIDYGATGTINLWRATLDGANSQLVATFTGDLTTDGETLLDEIYLGGFVNTSATSQYFSEVIVSDMDTRGMGMVAMEPASNAAQFEFNGSFADIADTGDNTTVDSTFISATADGQIASFLPNTARVGNFTTILGFALNHRSRAGAIVPKLTPLLTIGGVNYLGTTLTPGAAFTNYQEIFEVNPATGVRFTRNDLIAPNFSYGLRANT